jgi:hypothetical protein
MLVIARMEPDTPGTFGSRIVKWVYSLCLAQGTGDDMICAHQLAPMATHSTTVARYRVMIHASGVRYRKSITELSL